MFLVCHVISKTMLLYGHMTLWVKDSQGVPPSYQVL